MPILRTRTTTIPIAELRLPRLELELPAVTVVRVIATMKPITLIFRPAKPEEGEDHEPTT